MPAPQNTLHNIHEQMFDMWLWRGEMEGVREGETYKNIAADTEYG